jgi:sugar phosphate isomerase/epimerase
MPYVPCLNTSTIRPASLVDKIQAAARAGFRAIEPWNDDVDAYLKGGGTMESLKALLREHGLSVPSVIAVMGWIGCSDAERDTRRAEAIRRIEQAAALGAPHIVASPPGGTVDLDRAARDYRELLQLGKERGIRPSMEFLGFVQQINNINAAWEIVQRAGDPDGTIVIDWFHMVRGQASTLDDLRRIPAEKISIVHLDDVPYHKPFSEMTDADRVYPGDGNIPLDEMFGVLQEIGYNGAVSLELFNAQYWAQDPYEVVRTGFEKSKRWLAAA